jgi:hypothetical protein
MEQKSRRTTYGNNPTPFLFHNGALWGTRAILVKSSPESSKARLSSRRNDLV